ncbi:copper chaperone PCu(A)C [Nocardia sp. NBC_00881]|uniref:copper chaperone PCu(A)C n=1 Tax=Nocardia sp. NBC_00881 TaxID=2975995 RepID=UPI00386932B4|nr:copper chaperone PCu(A)C [Nocardia sp. NBC_00881]
MRISTFPSPRTGSRTSRVLRCAAAAAAVPFLLVACSSNDKPDTAKSADAVTITDQWVKAADSGMSAAFGDLSNSSDTPRTVVSASSPASSRIELHEVVADANGTKAMRPKPGGFVIPAHGTTRLRPGGDHIMFMGLNGPLRTGSETPVTLTFDDNSTTTFSAQVRDFSGNQENYVPDHASGEHGTGAQTPAHSG